MADRLAIQPASPLYGTVRPPGSKSLTNRALVCAAVASGQSRLTGVLDSDDTQVMMRAWRDLGVPVQHDPAQETVLVDGCGGSVPTTSAHLDLANSGTSIRFLSAMVATAHGTFFLDGNARMRQRPIKDLVDALRQLGVHAECVRSPDCPPIEIHADGLPGGVARVRGDVSSQFLSGLLMAAPLARRPVELAVVGPLVSQPYVRMTLGVMAAFGVRVPDGDLTRFVVPQTAYTACHYAIEPDATAASYFWGAAAVTGGRVTVAELTRESLQGDVAFCNALQTMGCSVDFGPAAITLAGARLHGVDIDMNAISDTVPTLAVVALFAEGPTTIRGVAHIRHKETDRIGDLARELRRLGAEVQEHSDGLTIQPGPPRGAEIETYQDHRMAMSFALAGLRIPGIVLRDPECTRKTYPQFFRDLERLRGGGPVPTARE